MNPEAEVGKSVDRVGGGQHFAAVLPKEGHCALGHSEELDGQSGFHGRMDSSLGLASLAGETGPTALRHPEEHSLNSIPDSRAGGPPRQRTAAWQLAWS